MTYEQYARNRDALFSRLLASLQADERFVAAWLTGSFGRGTEDNLSDFDLRIVVADAYVNILCSCEPDATTYTTNGTSEERRTLYRQFGEPLILREAPSFASDGEGGCFNHVVYRETATTIDWVFIPQTSARIPSEECRLLFDKVGLSMRPPPVAESLAERVAQAGREIGTFWFMTNVAIKYLLRGNTFAFYGFLNATEFSLQESKRLIAGKPQRYKYEEPTESIATAPQGHIALVRAMCSEMLEVMKQAEAMGAPVPEDPMSVTEVWLSMAQE
jgi:hypothetical protein